MMAVEKYLGKPWQAGADGPDAFDCFGLVRAFYRDHFGVQLPVVEVDAMSALQVRHAFKTNPQLSRWEEIEIPQPHCAVLMSSGKQPSHVGLYVDDVSGGRVLHCTRGAGVSLSSRLVLRMMSWNIIGYYGLRP